MGIFCYNMGPFQLHHFYFDAMTKRHPALMVSHELWYFWPWLTVSGLCAFIIKCRAHMRFTHRLKSWPPTPWSPKSQVDYFKRSTYSGDAVNSKKYHKEFIELSTFLNSYKPYIYLNARKLPLWDSRWSLDNIKKTLYHFDSLKHYACFSL